MPNREMPIGHKLTLIPAVFGAFNKKVLEGGVLKGELMGRLRK